MIGFYLAVAVSPEGFKVDSPSGLSFKSPKGERILLRMGMTKSSVLPLAPKRVPTILAIAGFNTPSSKPCNFSRTAVSRLHAQRVDD